MNLSNLHFLACSSFNVKFVRGYFTITKIIKGFFIGFFLSLFILLEFFNISILHEALGFLAFGYLLTQDKRVAFWSGFFVGIFWFYWISFSFIYYNMWYLIPFIILLIGLIYGFLFWICFKITQNIFLKAILLLTLSLYVHPFSFNWFDLRLMLVNSHFKVDVFSSFLFFLASANFFAAKRYWKILSIVLLLLCVDFSSKEEKKLPFKIELVNTYIAQNEKWKEELRDTYVWQNLQKINKAKKEKKRLIVFPESAFPLYLNKTPNLVKLLKEHSNDIAIITGALTFENDKFYNSTYLFDKGEMKIFHKVFLVPFGEEVPLPNFIKRVINKIFYNEAEDFSSAKDVQDYTIDGVKIRNAICFEATKSFLYKGDPDFLIALSNNAWFTPSSEAVLQALLLKLYSRLHGTTIYHSVNGSKSDIIYNKRR